MAIAQRLNVAARRALFWVMKRTEIELRRKPAALIRSPHELDLTPALVAAEVAARPSPERRTVVQIGAFDAEENDPVTDIIRRYGWRGILVEPQPGPFEKARDAHAGSEGVDVFNVALGETNGEGTLYTFDTENDLPEWAQQLASFNVDHLRRHGPAGATIKPITVPTWTFEKLLTEAGANRVDMLQIDTEGYDYEVLRMFDFERWQPAIVNYEYAHLSRADQAAAADLLISLGYRLSLRYLLGCCDVLAYRPEAA